MYVVRDRQTKTVIHINRAPLSQALSTREVFYQFDPERMEIGRTDERELPPAFDIDADGRIVPVSPGPPPDAVPDVIARLSEPDSTAAPAEIAAARERLRAHVAARISAAFSPGEEAKRMKGYLAWLADGCPENDARRRAYDEMQAAIGAIRAPYAAIKARLKALAAE